MDSSIRRYPSYVAMKVLSRLPTTLVNIHAPSILTFVITSYGIIFKRVILFLHMWAPTSNLPIFSQSHWMKQGFANYEVNLVSWNVIALRPRGILLSFMHIANNLSRCRHVCRGRNSIHEFSTLYAMHKYTKHQ